MALGPGGITPPSRQAARIQKTSPLLMPETPMTGGGRAHPRHPRDMHRVILRAPPTTTPTRRVMLVTILIPTALLCQTKSFVSVMAIMRASRMARLTPTGPSSNLPTVRPCIHSLRRTQRTHDILPASHPSRVSILTTRLSHQCRSPWVHMARQLMPDLHSTKN